MGNNNLSCHSFIFFAGLSVEGYGAVGGFWSVRGAFEASLRVPAVGIDGLFWGSLSDLEFWPLGSKSLGTRVWYSCKAPTT